MTTQCAVNDCQEKALQGGFCSFHALSDLYTQQLTDPQQQLIAAQRREELRRHAADLGLTLAEPVHSAVSSKRKQRSPVL